MFLGERLSNTDLLDFSDMHRKILPGSLVASLGESYTRRFYEYVNQSASEFVLVRRAEGKLEAGCVVSLDPESLGRRLLSATPVVRSALKSATKIPWGRIARGIIKAKKNELPDFPEILLIFAIPKTQGRGHGTNLVAEVEQVLAIEGHKGLRVKTLADPNNKARGFYLRCGFEHWGEVASLGKQLAVFSKEIRVPLNADSP